MSPSPPSLATISVQITLNAPSFVPGSLVTATITLRADPPSPTLSHSTSHPSHPNPRATHTAIYSTSLSTLSHDSTPALVDYVVTELSGRWSSDRAWVVPHAHPDASDHTLDYHLKQPVTQHSSHTRDVTLLPWAAALADANNVGGGGRPGHTGIVFRSPALVVCEREQIPVGSQVCFEVSCVLPDRLPPSLRGIAMRYSYALVVVVGFAGCGTPRVVRVPLRVVSAGGTGHDLDRALEVIRVPTPRDVGPVSNRFLEEKEVRALTMRARLVKGAPPDDIEIALALSLNGRLTPYKADEERRMGDDEMGGLGMIRDLKVVTVGGVGREEVKKRNAIPVYGISYLGASVARMYLSKRVHHLGDTVSAIFHFTGERECYRLGARLEMQEVIRREFAVGQKTGGGVGGQGDEEDEDQVLFRRVYGEHGEFVMANRNTHITFSIPHDASPSFVTSVVAVKWRIHFVFLIPRKGDGHENQAHMVRGGGDVDEIDPLLDELRVEENGSGEREVAGWEGGVWEGEDPRNWKHLPQKDVDVLRWTLPLVVSGQAGSHWGSRSSGKLVYTMK